LRALAVTVAYSRVHTGVHYPGDVIAGALTGVTLAELTGRAISAYAATQGGRRRIAPRGWRARRVSSTG
jgi:undecaprenyl-diphosphatase